MSSIPPPLAVDLDGTLLRSDSLLESALVLLREQPLQVLWMLLALLRGRAHLKAWLAQRAMPDIASLPLNQALLEWLKEQRKTGRQLLLVSAADQRIACAVAERVGLFDEVLASDGQRNLKGADKAALLVQRFGKGGYDYAGDSLADVPVWAAARLAIVVGGPRLQRRARQVAELGWVHNPTDGRLQATMRALRPHQWVKNLLVFLPLLAVHRYHSAPDLLLAVQAFLAFSLTASAVYLINDLVDLSADRRHPRKRLRPFAAGTLPLSWGLSLAPVLLLAAALVCMHTNAVFSLVLLGYLLLTTLYSLKLKRVPVLDVLTLAALYTMRVIGGAVALLLLPSFWLLALSMFMFFSLALVKRYTELRGLRERGKLVAPGRGWQVTDLPLVGAMGAASAMAAILVLALYVDSVPSRQHYASPEVLWLVCPLLLYWISRVWFKAHRGEMHEDPVVFALRDRASLATGVLVVLSVLFAVLGVR